MLPELIQVRIHGRGGQGVVTAAELIALAASFDGHEAQAFPFFGVERSGAPVMSFARLSDTPIKTREQVYQPDYLIIQDDTLMSDPQTLQGVTSKTKLIINSPLPPTAIAQQLNKMGVKNIIPVENIFTAPATAIAMKTIGRNIVNTVILGALAKRSDLFSLASLKQAVRQELQSKGEAVLAKNLEAISSIYEVS